MNNHHIVPLTIMTIWFVYSPLYWIAFKTKYVLWSVHGLFAQHAIPPADKTMYNKAISINLPVGHTKTQAMLSLERSYLNPFCPGF